LTAPLPSSLSPTAQTACSVYPDTDARRMICNAAHERSIGPPKIRARRRRTWMPRDEACTRNDWSSSPSYCNTHTIPAAAFRACAVADHQMASDAGVETAYCTNFVLQVLGAPAVDASPGGRVRGGGCSGLQGGRVGFCVTCRVCIHRLIQPCSYITLPLQTSRADGSARPCHLPARCLHLTVHFLLDFAR